MPEHNLFQIYISRLEKLNIRYIATGAVASIIYGEPRLTHDIDLIVELTDENAETIIGAFPSEKFYCPPIEIIKLEADRPRRGHFNLIHHETGFKADIYIAGQDELHNWAMSKRKRFDMEGGPIWVAPPEYVILRKLEYYREGKSEKHMRDISSILDISSDLIDFEQLENKVSDSKLQMEWEQVLKVR
ncbi:MAG: hypothetical protein JRC68_08670 [Deltaproteobacteria bacterium]|nr:hypothetical protein [Deltaproteobacteria bacterium]